MRGILRLLNRIGIGRAIALFLLLDLVLLRIWDPFSVEALRLKAFDLYQSLAPRAAAQRPVVIVDIDENSLKKLGQWPWPRTLIADLTTKLTRAGAVAIAFDVLFPEPDRQSPAVAADGFRGLDDDVRAKLKALPSNDEVFAGAMTRSRVILGQSGLPFPTEPPADAAPQTGFGVKGPVAEPGLVAFPGLLRNLSVLENAAPGRGLITIRPERDGVVRRVPIVMKAEGMIVPSLSLEVLRVLSGSPAILIRTDPSGVQGVALRGLEIPTDAIGQMWVHFGPHDPARYVSAADFIEDRVAADRVRGKIVLVGTSATGLLDIKTTPIDPGMPGVEVHAQLLESMLSKSVLSASSYGTLTEIAIAAGISLAIIAFAPMISAWTLFLLGSVAATAIVALSWYYFTQQHLLIDFTFPLGSTFATYSTVVFTNYLRAHNERRQIRSAFSQYLSPALVAQLAESPEKLVLGGEERTMTFLFSDVRGFTTISETYKHDPHGLTQLMNRLLTPLTNVIIERKGTIDKYMGDAIMAFWNAPLTDADHELNACDAALAMLVALDDLNRQRRAEAETSGLPFVALKVGVGLNTGSCVVGNMGSDLHFNYSVLGDAVNLASRLESQSKEYGVSIVIGSRTATAVRDRFGTVELDLLQVKGKTEPEPVHTILGRLDSPARASMDRLMSLNAAMLAAYRSREWGSCLETILQCRELSREFGLDDFYSIYTQRVRRLSEAPPEPSWNGVWIAERK